MRKITQARIERDGKYYAMRDEIMAQQPQCVFKLEGCTFVATDLHHAQGRGSKMLNRASLKPCCRNCHDIVEGDPIRAKELGHSQSKLT